MSESRDWDATTYDRVGTPQLDWAAAVIERLAPSGEETVLDAGCGSGRVTELLLERLPRGRVIAVDGSVSMIEAARERLESERVSFVHTDLLDLDLREKVDAVFSNAVFHWILDHERLFARLHSALRPGGRFEAQCGGLGNVAGFYAAVASVASRDRYTEHLTGYDPHRFASVEETEALLRAAGFAEVSCTLEPWPVRPPEPRDFISSICIGAHAEQLPPNLRPAFLDAVMAELGNDPVLDYVRLNISARREAALA